MSGINILLAAPDGHPLNFHWSRLSINFPIKAYTRRLYRSLQKRGLVMLIGRERHGVLCFIPTPQKLQVVIKSYGLQLKTLLIFFR